MEIPAKGDVLYLYDLSPQQARIGFEYVAWRNDLQARKEQRAMLSARRAHEAQTGRSPGLAAQEGAG